MTEQQLVPLIVQIPLVFAFMWFTLRLSGDHRADAIRRDVQWQAFIEQQNILWRNFIKDLTEQGRASNDLTSQRLSELAQIISSLLDDFKVHDQRTNVRGKQV
jgi:hypothetical protein